MVDVQNGVYDCVEVDSEVERDFAEAMSSTAYSSGISPRACELKSTSTSRLACHPRGTSLLLVLCRCSITSPAVTLASMPCVHSVSKTVTIGGAKAECHR